MNISIGINGFKQFKDLKKTERFCIESLLKIKNKLPNINLYNVCFDNENINYDGFTTLNRLQKKSNVFIKEYFQHEGLKKEYDLKKNEIDNNNRSLPSVKEIFDVLASTNCDYFLFLNNDIIISDRLFKLLDDSFDAYPISRMHIYDIADLNEVPKLESYSVHGFDAFLIKKETWLKIRNNFEDFILGRFYWDTYFATMFKLFSNSKFYNQLPPLCFHIEHGSTSSEKNIENYYNDDLFKRNLLVQQLWYTYAYNAPLKRPTINECKWFQPLETEIAVEKQVFNPFPVPSFKLNKHYLKSELLTEDKSDIFIPVTDKDLIKLPYLIESIFQNINFNKIFITSPNKISQINDSRIVYCLDNDVLPNINLNEFSFRPGWIYQQFLKMFQNVTERNYYTVVDSDAYFLKPINFFNSDKQPVWHYGWKQNNTSYFLFLQKVLNLNKSLTHTGIGDLGLFNKQIIKSILDFCSCSSYKEFIDHIKNKMHLFFHFSEYETYSNFVNTHYHNHYEFKHFNQFNKGKDLNHEQNWTIQDIEQTIKKAKQTDADILLMHSWNYNG